MLTIVIKVILYIAALSFGIELIYLAQTGGF
jgi:hypothetical protein